MKLSDIVWCGVHVRVHFGTEPAIISFSGPTGCKAGAGVVLFLKTGKTAVAARKLRRLERNMNGELFPNEQELCAAKILIVDDEEADIHVLEWALRVSKFLNVRSVTDSARAVDVFQEFQPDLVMLDLYMPEPDGFAILKEIRATRPAGDFLPVLVLTGYDTAATRSEAMAAGANDFLGKPVDCTEVLLRIRNLLQTRFLYRQAQAMQGQLKTLAANKETKT